MVGSAGEWEERDSGGGKDGETEKEREKGSFLKEKAKESESELLAPRKREGRQ